MRSKGCGGKNRVSRAARLARDHHRVSANSNLPRTCAGHTARTIVADIARSSHDRARCQDRHRRACASLSRRRRSSCRSPAPASRPNAASRISVRPAASGPRCGRSTFRISSPARRRATNPGGGASPWRNSSAARSPGAAIRRSPALYRAGKSPGVVTQNIDNLHQASGIAAEHVVELHGNTTYATCLDCATRYELPWVRQRFERERPRAVLPVVRRPHQDRDGLVRPGDARRGDAPRRGTDSARLIFSSRSAPRWWCGRRPAFPLMAKRNGARLVIINRDPTEFDDIADLVVRHDIGAVLEPFISKPNCRILKRRMRIPPHCAQLATGLSAIAAISSLRAAAAMLC